VDCRDGYVQGGNEGQSVAVQLEALAGLHHYVANVGFLGDPKRATATFHYPGRRVAQAQLLARAERNAQSVRGGLQAAATPLPVSAKHAA